MSELPTHVLVVETTVDASRDAEFNDWYDHVHLPDLKNVPGVLAARRYSTDGTLTLDRDEVNQQAARRYLTLYDLESPAVFESAEFRAVPGFGELGKHVTAVVSVFGALDG
jgi:hypothetical protein